MTTHTLLNNVDVDTVGEWFPWNGGAAEIFVTADDFGGGTVTLQRSADQENALPVNFIDSVEFSATEGGTFPVSGWSSNTFIRATLAGATSPANVKVLV